MDRYDVLIVGGGPAGSTCARRLVAAGLNVAVMDKKRFPRDKVCAGWITPAVVEELELDVGDYRHGRVFQPIQRFITGVIHGPEVVTHYDHAMSFGIRRCEFDHYLLKRSGARLLLGEAVTDLDRSHGHWLVNGHIRTPMLVGAGGHFCPVARFLGAKLGSNETVVAAQEVEFEMNPVQAAACAVAPDRPELFFCPDLTGYGWCFRKGDYLNVGLGREDSHKISDHVAAFCDFLQSRGRVPADIPRRFLGHAYLLYRQAEPRRLLRDGVVLIGDAAGLAYPQSGEGIRPAVESGLMAAATILRAQGDYRVQNLAGYETALAARFGDRNATGGDASWLPAVVRERLAARLLSCRWFSRKVVLDRWFLHTQDGAFTASNL